MRPARIRDTLPLRSSRTISRSRRNIASIPTRRQKSARLVQQAILTCWQLSTSSPETRILKRARATSQPGPAFQKRQSQAAIHETRGDRQPGEPAAHDEDMRCRGSRCHFSGMTDSLYSRMFRIKLPPRIRQSQDDLQSARSTTMPFRHFGKDTRPSSTS